MVVKLHTGVDHALVPPVLVAFTRQKYCWLLARPPTVCESAVRPPVLYTKFANVLTEDTCSVYDAALAAAFQLRARPAIGWFVLPVAGKARTGTSGCCGTVVKLRAVAHALPPAFIACTRQ